ncbi:GFA family protein [Pseudomonas sp. BN414]|uniref:GFA family protein n=1 Tax=Pseudomonas sp. BN414 TaxID=2567888 RepID=UPI002458D561|nr:GFA family protein [Pseudomonas sp. BN414]MDH4565424.1 GFA family protein [Pseudomonas sp. BN414]
MPITSYEGGCLCGHVRFRVTGIPANPHACSCDFCQRHSGAATLCWVEFHRGALQWIGEGGAPALFRSSDYSSRAFCPRCGSTLGAVDDDPVIALVTGVFDRRDAPELRPLSHSFQDVCPDWCRVTAC